MIQSDSVSRNQRPPVILPIVSGHISRLNQKIFLIKKKKSYLLKQDLVYILFRSPYGSAACCECLFSDRPVWGWLWCWLPYLDHTGEVSCICQLQDNVQLIVLNKRCVVLYHVGVVQLLLKREKKIETRNFVVTLIKKGITLWNDRIF